MSGATAGAAPRDPGLQAERTRLAWGRTALGIATNAVLVARVGVHQSVPALTAVGGLLAVASAFMWGFGRVHARRMEREGAAPDRLAVWHTRAAAAITVACGAAAGAALVRW